MGLRVKNLDAVKDVARVVIDAQFATLNDGGKKKVFDIRREIEQAGAVSTGKMLRAVGFKIKGEELHLFIDSVYAIVQEFGQKPGSFGRIRNFITWVRFKKQLDTRAAFAIRRSVRTEGLRGKGFFEKSMKSIEPEIIKIFDKNFKKEKRRRNF